MKQTRRGFFATLFAAVVAKVCPEPTLSPRPRFEDFVTSGKKIGTTMFLRKPLRFLGTGPGLFNPTQNVYKQWDEARKRVFIPIVDPIGTALASIDEDALSKEQS